MNNVRWTFFKFRQVAARRIASGVRKCPMNSLSHKVSTIQHIKARPSTVLEGLNRLRVGCEAMLRKEQSVDGEHQRGTCELFGRPPL